MYDSAVFTFTEKHYKNTENASKVTNTRKKFRLCFLFGDISGTIGI